ncbi:MAG: YebC/PmpR family DNA-binding transcriptional regulator, partial [Planctomycetes bacterium]|nr:YebC/PmpR family DNA-binding transcriptional regulator [Planctomycetota bacterium]
TGEKFEVTCEVENYSRVGEALEQNGVRVEVKEVTRVPNNTVDLGVDDARKVLKLLEALDDHDDVQNVSANFNISEEAMAQLTVE